MTLQTDVRTDGRLDGRGYNNIPAFSYKSARIKMLYIKFASDLPELCFFFFFSVFFFFLFVLFLFFLSIKATSIY